MTKEPRIRHTAGPWLREGTTVYALEHDRFVKGREEFRNRFWVQVFGSPGTPAEELEANAILIQVAPAMLEELKRLAYLFPNTLTEDVIKDAEVRA
jgi:hypothetical protein